MILLLMHIERQSPQWFAATFAIAFLLLLIIFMADGLSKRHSFLSLTMVILSMVLFFVIGMKAGTFNTLAETLHYIRYSSASTVLGKSAAMGMLLAIPALILCITVLKLPASLLDSLAYALPAAQIIQRIGCLANGCCYGQPTGVPWGIEYGNGTLVWNHQHELGLTSMAVHPVPIYYIVSGISTLFLLYLIRHQKLAPGNKLIISLLMLLLGRFIADFFRDNTTMPMIGQTVGGLLIIQWMILAMMLIGVWVLIYRQRKGLINPPAEQTPSLTSSLILTTVLLGITSYYQNSLTPLESIVLVFFLMMAFAALGIETMRRLFARTNPAIYLTLSTLLLLNMAQSTGDSLRVKKSKILEKSTDISFSYTGGQIHNLYTIDGSSSGEDCYGTPATMVDSKLDYSGINMAAQFNTLYQKQRRNELMLAGAFMAGHENSDFTTTSKPMISLAISNRYYGGVAGFGAGFSFGTAPDYSGYNDHLMPYLAVFLGPPKYFYFEGALGDYTLCPLPLVNPSFGFGTHFGSNDDLCLRAGIFANKGYYGRMQVPVNNHFSLSFQYTNISDNSSFDGSNQSFNVGLSYKIPHKSIQPKPE
jgi:phosphatidylglycerol:prolipoprotein diacylglycerol transferase